MFAPFEIRFARISFLQASFRFGLLFSLTLGAASNAFATGCWCTISTSTFKSADGTYYSRGSNTIHRIVQSCPADPYSAGVGLTLAGPGAIPNACDNLGGFYCLFPGPGATAPEGTHNYTLGCEILDKPDYENGGVPLMKYDSATITLVIDDTAPTVTFDGATPPDGSTLPFASFHVSGGFTDASPIVEFSASAGSVTFTGSTWDVDFVVSTSVGGSPPATGSGIPQDGAMEFTLSAKDIVGNRVVFSTAGLQPFAATADLTLRRTWYFDSTPPVVVMTAPGALVKQFAAITGTSFDAVGVSRIKIAVRDASSGKYWNGTGFQSAAIFTVATGTTQWNFPLDSRLLSLGRLYEVLAEAEDSPGNKTNPPTVIGSFTIEGQTLTTAANAVNMGGIFSFTPANGSMTYGGSLVVCAEVNANVSQTMRGIALNSVVFETSAGGALRPFLPTPGDSQPLSIRLPWTCGQSQSGIPLRIQSDVKRCLDVGKLTARVHLADAGSVNISVLVPTETRSVYQPQDHTERILNGDTTACDGASWCAFDVYNTYFERAQAPLNLLNQRYREVVSKAKHLVVQGVSIPFCDVDHEEDVRQTGWGTFLTPGAAYDPDRVGIVRSPDAARPEEQHLVDIAAVNLAFQTQRPYKCGAESLQHYFVNNCRIPRARNQFIRQRTQVILLPRPTGSDPAFSTSKSDEKPTPHGNLDSQ